MTRRVVVISCALACIAPFCLAAPSGLNKPGLTADEVVSRSVAATGGLQAWRAVQSLSMQGKLGVGGNQRTNLPASLPGKKSAVLPTDPRPAAEVQLPFLMELQRPFKMRLELEFKGQTAVQVYDGTNGWKLRPYLNRAGADPYTADELKRASMEAPLDGPLVDYAAKGTRVDLDGQEQVDGRATYKLKLTLKGGDITHVWVDAQTFLEAKSEGQPRRLDGVQHAVEIFYKDYHTVSGLKIPFLLETQVLPLPSDSTRNRQDPIPVEQILIEKVTLNPPLQAALFTRPQDRGSQVASR